MICLILAIVIWFVISLSNEKQYTLFLPVEYQLEENKLVLSQLPEEYQLSVQGKTSALIAFELAAKNRPTKIDIKHKNDLSAENVNAIFIDRLENYNLNLLRNQTSTVPIELDSLVRKNVGVKNSTQVNVKEGYVILEQVLEPSQIEISGPATFVRYVDSLGTSKTVFRDVDRDFRDSIPILKSLSELITLEQSNVILEVRVAKLIYHELAFSCEDLLIPNESYDSILIQLMAPEDFIFKPSQFKATIDAPVKGRAVILVNSNHPNIKMREVLPIRK